MTQTGRLGRSLCLVLVVLGALFGARQAAAAQERTKAPEGEPSLTLQRAEDAVLLAFAGLPVASARQDKAKGEILLRFERALPGAAAQTWPDKLSAFGSPFAYATPGFDSLLIVLDAPAEIAMRRGDSGRDTGGAPVFMIRIAAPTAPPGQAGEEDSGAVRVQIQQARLLWRQGKREEARTLLGTLEQRHPNHPGVLRTRADFEREAGDWRAAAERLERAIAQRPEDEGLSRARSELLRTQGSRIALETERQTLEDGDEQESLRLRGQVHITDRLTLVLRGERRRLEDEELLAPDGEIIDLDRTRMKGEIGLAWRHDWGLTTLSVLPAEGSIGGHLSHEIETGFGTLGFAADYRRPYWDLVEGLAFGATRDAATLSLRSSLLDGLSTEIEGRLGRYSYDTEDDAGRFVGFRAAVRYGRDLGFAYGGIGLSVDGEYVDEVLVRQDPFGTDFTPLPLDDREVYAVDLGLSGRTFERLDWSVYGGYAYDRFANDGPFGGVTLAYRLSDALDLTLSASHSRVNGRGESDGGALTRIGAGLVVHLPFLREGARRD